jgi:hypothetical protein
MQLIDFPKVFIYIFCGVLGVTNIVLWGIYGDLLIEKFDLRKVLRSIFLGVVYSLYLFFVNNSLPPFVVVLNVVALERITTEFYKALIRNEKQKKYKIPSDWNIHLPRPLEIITGYFLIFGILLLIYTKNIGRNLWLILFIPIFFSAICGAAKDAPYEGFAPKKFFRSPLVVSIVAAFLMWSFPTLEGKYLLLSISGGERIISECYKKIIKGNIPGKFREDIHHQLRHSWSVTRYILLIPYAINLLLILSLSGIN